MYRYIRKGDGMSFSGEVKKELEGRISPARHCQIAEIAALLGCLGIKVPSPRSSGKAENAILLRTENGIVARKVFTLLKKTFNIIADISVSKNPGRENVAYTLYVPAERGSERVLSAIRDSDNGAGRLDIVFGHEIVLRSLCCRRAFLRGIFLAAGSVSDPHKSYHFEIVVKSETDARTLAELIGSLHQEAKIVSRKRAFVVYVKEGSQIVDLLGLMDAKMALMELENVRILKEMRNTVNRKVNCETANINKTVSAAVKQAEDIVYIRDTIGLTGLSEALEEMANIRLAYPEASLKELGQLVSPPVGKSGVNHRLRKLSEMADSLRQKQGGYE